MTNILVTGAGGYIGGSIVADFAHGKGGLVEEVQIHAAVRSEEQAKSLSGLDVSVLQVDLSDGKALEGYLVENDVDIVINTATSIDSNAVLNLVSALGRRQSLTGKKTYFVHTSGLSAFDENTGWPFGEVRDTDPVFGLEKKSSDTYVVRKVDTFTAEQVKAHGITGFTVMPPTIRQHIRSDLIPVHVIDEQLDGRGSGTWNKLSPQLPGLVRAGIAQRQVYKFPENREVPLVHISDLTTFFTQLVKAILREEKLPTGYEGYYFTVSHRVHWWDILDRLARALHASGLVKEPTTQVWPSDEVAAGVLGVPKEFAHSIWDSGPKVIAVNPDKVGWQPTWDGDKLLQSLDDEINDVLEVGTPKSSLLGSLNPKIEK